MMEENPDPLKNTGILLVEDNATDVKILLRALEKENFLCEVHDVRNGKEALAFLNHQGKYQDAEKYPRPDIILLDINMPEMDGHTFVREIKGDQSLKSIPIIVFTTKKGMEDILTIEGVNDYVVKSIAAKDLVTKMRRLLKI